MTTRLESVDKHRKVLEIYRKGQLIRTVCIVGEITEQTIRREKRLAAKQYNARGMKQLWLM